MQVDDAPGREDGLLIRVAEGGEDVRDALDAFLYGEAVGGAGHASDAFAGFAKDVLVVVSLEALEELLGDTAGHELLPGAVVDEGGEVVDGQLAVLVLDIGSVEHEGHTNRYAAEDGDGTGALFALLLALAEHIFFFRGTLSLLLLFDTFDLLVLLVGEALPVDVDIECAG